MAISIEALSKLWPAMPPSLLKQIEKSTFQEAGNISKLITPLERFIQKLDDFIYQMPTLQKELQNISDSFDDYILQPDCETVSFHFKEVCTPFFEFSTLIRQYNDLAVISISQRFWLMKTLSDFNEQRKILEENVDQFCKMYGTVLEEDQLEERQKLQQQLSVLIRLGGSILEAAQGLYEELHRRQINSAS